MMLFGFGRRQQKLTTVELDRLLRGPDTTTGVEVSGTTALRHGPVFACIRVLAESVGQIPLNLFEERDDGTKIKARNHPLYSLLHTAPNSFQTTQEWLEQAIAHQCLAGNAYSFINRVNGRVVELLPLNPRQVHPRLINRGGDVAYDVEFTDGKRDVLPADRVLHLRTFSIDGFRGVSPINYAANTIGFGVAVERHAGALFRNGASARGVLSTDAILTDDEYSRIRDSWEAAHQGVANAHRVAILEAGLRWTNIGMSAEDAQMLESRKFSRTEICGIFRVPPHMIADLERATFSNVEAQQLSYVTLALVPYLKRIEDRISLQLLTEQERRRLFAKFNLNAIVRGDMTTRSNFYTRQLMVGAMSPNEIRELEDMNPREGGDVFYTPANMVPSGGAESTVPEPLPTEPAPPGGNVPGEPAPGETLPPPEEQPT